MTWNDYMNPREAGCRGLLDEALLFVDNHVSEHNESDEFWVMGLKVRNRLRELGYTSASMYPIGWEQMGGKPEDYPFGKINDAHSNF